MLRLEGRHRANCDCPQNHELPAGGRSRIGHLARSRGLEMKFARSAGLTEPRPALGTSRGTAAQAHTRMVPAWGSRIPAPSPCPGSHKSNGNSPLRAPRAGARLSRTDAQLGGTSGRALVRGTWLETAAPPLLLQSSLVQLRRWGRELPPGQRARVDRDTLTSASGTRRYPRPVQVEQRLAQASA